MAEELAFKAGDNPNDFTVPQVVKFLKGDDVTGDEYDRVMQAEREGQGRVGIINLSGAETEPPAETETTEQPAPVAPAETETTDDDEEAEEDEAPEPVSADEAVRQAQARIDARRGRNFDEVLQTRGDRAHGE